MKSTSSDASGDGPMQRAQQAMRPALPRRFYKKAEGARRDDHYELLLDGKPARTPAGHLLALPTRELCDSIAAEWNALGQTIDPARLPLTRLANVAIDRVAQERVAVIDEIARYSGSDLVCYRAEGPAGLVAAQRAAWDPIVAWARDTLGARVILAEGVRFVEQPPHALAAMRREVEQVPAPFGLAALASATVLTGSALLALALLRGRIGADAAWAAAHVDEDWNIRQWGADAEAAERRAARRAEFDAAALFLDRLR